MLGNNQGQQKRSIEEIIEGLNLRRLSRTPNGYKACCAINPNHVDHSPSMHIHIDKALVKCFSCGAFKPLFDFLLDNGCSFDEAVEFLFLSAHAERVEGSPMKEWVLGRKLPKSMLDRGYTKDTLRHFRVGFDEEQWAITIPLIYNDNIYGIQYRQYPKNFWASDGFVKDNFVYNYEPTDHRVYTEGFTDVWRIWQNGTKEVSGILTAYPSEGQLQLMRRHKEITLALDNDKAGWKGEIKINKELGREVDLYVAVFRGKDAGEQSKDSWQEAYDNRVPYVAFEVALIKRNPELYERLYKEVYGRRP